MLIFQPPVNFCSDENIQTIFGTNLEDFLNYRIDYNSISQTIEKVVKKIFFSAPKASKIGDRQVLVEPTMALLWRPLDVLLFRRPKKYFSASQSGKYSVTLHFRSREVRFPVQCQKFLVECGKNLVEYGKMCGHR
jgi:hypothetical protein